MVGIGILIWDPFGAGVAVRTVGEGWMVCKLFFLRTIQKVIRMKNWIEDFKAEVKNYHILYIWHTLEKFMWIIFSFPLSCDYLALPDYFATLLKSTHLDRAACCTFVTPHKFQNNSCLQTVVVD